jgi:hypothetical protein
VVAFKTIILSVKYFAKVFDKITSNIDDNIRAKAHAGIRFPVRRQLGFLPRKIKQVINNIQARRGYGGF